MKTEDTKKYPPMILNVFEYRGSKIKEIYNRKTKRREFKTRFQMNGREFRLVDDNRKTLEEMIEEIRAQTRREKHGLPTPVFFPTVEDIFNKNLARLKIAGGKNCAFFERVSKKILRVFPDGLRLNELRRAHFQTYIDARLAEKNMQTGGIIQPATVNKEISSAAAALRRAPLDYPELDDFQLFQVPKAKTKKSRRERLIQKSEIDALINYLARPQEENEKPYNYFHRVRLAHIFEFGLLTGLRRKEIATLKFSDYDADENSLRVTRWKTSSVDYFSPLPKRAVEIINSRRDLQKDVPFIFTPRGKAIESNYRTLKEAAAALKIDYGRTGSGFTLHDARHNFTTKMLRVADIETVRSFTSHRGDDILTYAHATDESRRRAIRKFEGADVDEELKQVFEAVRDGKTDLLDFIKTVKAIF